uniref:Velvet domain-containing protein n=1 Tax=Panagrellus redivivus TaxID=6233 RepID=A0A7E4UQR5_PANRE
MPMPRTHYYDAQSRRPMLEYHYVNDDFLEEADDNETNVDDDDSDEYSEIFLFDCNCFSSIRNTVSLRRVVSFLTKTKAAERVSQSVEEDGSDRQYFARLAFEVTVVGQQLPQDK